VTTRVHRAALAYAERLSWKIFPCFGKFPALSREEGGHGFKDGTADLEQIDRWWWRWPNANIGLACGLSDLAVVDIDQHGKDGDAAWAEYSASHPVPDTPEGLTGGGGRHLFFAADVPSRVLCEGVELKAGGGYVILPPSRHPSGREYAWDAGYRIDETPIAPLPEWLFQKIGRRKARNYVEHESRVEPTSFYLGFMFEYAGLLGERIGNGKWVVTCPNEHNHLHRSGTSSTVLFAPEKLGGRGTFYCSHTSSCSEVFR
jgi:hypothetical protein